MARWQQKQNANNNFSAVVPYELEQTRGKAKEFLDDLTARDQRMIFAVVTLVHIADTLEQLDADTETLMAIGRNHLCQFSVLRYQQEDGLNTALPYGLRASPGPADPDHREHRRSSCPSGPRRSRTPVASTTASTPCPGIP